MLIINVDKAFTLENRYSNFLENIKKRVPSLELEYIKSFSTDLSINFEIKINDNNTSNIEAIIKKMYSFN